MFAPCCPCSLREIGTNICEPTQTTTKCFNQSENRSGLLVMCYVLLHDKCLLLLEADLQTSMEIHKGHWTNEYIVTTTQITTKYISTYETPHCCSSLHFWLNCYAEHVRPMFCVTFKPDIRAH